MDNQPDKTVVQMTVYELTPADAVKLGVIVAATAFATKVALAAGARIVTPKIRRLTERLEAKKAEMNEEENV